MAPRDNLAATLPGERAFDADIVAHVDQEAGYIHEDVAGGRSAGRAVEVIAAGAETGDGGVEAFLAEDVIALESERADERTVAYRTHEVGVIAGDIVQGSIIHELVPVAFHPEKFLEIHDGLNW